jgi:hypothetical protein
MTMVFAWPLSWSPATIAVDQGLKVDSGRLIDQEADRQALRNLRAMVLPRMTSEIYVRTTDGALFSVFLRDEPPPAVMDALTRARAQ